MKLETVKLVGLAEHLDKHGLRIVSFSWPDGKRPMVTTEKKDVVAK